MKLLDWRTGRKLSQRDVADAIGVTAMSVSRIEKGAQQPSPEVAQRIDDFTRGEVTAASLLGLSEVRHRKPGVREDAASFDAPHLTVDVPLPTERARRLQNSGADIKAIARAGADKALKEAEAKAWADANREAIEAANAWIEKHGTFAEQVGLI